ncbi:retrovirus-related pol polyprotein from transposon TNT 1-94 [Tanacetum coccineum]
MTTLHDLIAQAMQKKEEEKRIAEEQAPKERYWKIPICDDDDDNDYTIAITPVLSTEEPVNSLIMENEHLDTISATESDEFIKSSVEILVPIPSESKGVPKVCDVPFHDNSPPLDISKDQSEDFSDSNVDSTSTDEDSFSSNDVEYVEASPPNSEPVSSKVMEIVIPEVGRIEDDILLIKDDTLREKLLNVNRLVAKIKALKDNPVPSSVVVTKSTSTFPNLFLEETNTFDNSLPESETFCFNLEEPSSGSPTTPSDLSLPDYLLNEITLKMFGSLCYPTNDYDDVGKLKAKADIGIFVGYAPTKKAYRIYNKRTRKIQETVHVAFDELTEGLTSVQTSSGLAPQQMTSVQNSTELELTALQSGRSRSALVKDPEPPSVPPTKKQVDDLFQWFDDDEVVPIPPVVPITPVNVPAAPAPENANGSPSTTVISEGAPAVTENLLPHQIPLPDTSDSDDNILIIPLKWIFKIKLDEYGDVLKNKARLVAKGYRQEAGIDFEEHCLRLLDLKHQNSHSHAARFVDPAASIACVPPQKALYDSNTLARRDDIIFASTNPKACKLFAFEMNSTFKMSMMGQMSFFLGLQVSQNPRGIFINQSKYAQEILKKFGFDSCTPIDTPMAERPNLDEDKGGKLIDPTRFRGMVGSLMYLSASRPDIVFADTEESAVKPEPELKNTIECNLNPSDGRKAQ